MDSGRARNYAEGLARQPSQVIEDDEVQKCCLLTRGQRKRLRGALSYWQETTDQAWHVLSNESECAPVVCEVFGRGSLSSEIEKGSYGCRAGPKHDLVFGHNFLNPSHRKQVRQELYSCKPDLLVITPPCTEFCILQYLNDYLRFERGDIQGMRRRRLGLRSARILLNYAVILALDQLDRGGHILFERPRYAKSWEEKMLKMLSRHPRIQSVELWINVSLY